jgi:cytochrome P450
MTREQAEFLVRIRRIQEDAGLSDAELIEIFVSYVFAEGVGTEAFIASLTAHLER